MDRLVLCEKCGYFKAIFSNDVYIDCPVCNTKLHHLSVEKNCPNFFHMSFAAKDNFVENFSGKKMDSIAREQRLEYERKQRDRIHRIMSSPNGNSSAKCPSCGSSNTSKIGTLNRAFSVSLFGLASSKIGKTHKCNRCGTTW